MINIEAKPVSLKDLDVFVTGITGLILSLARWQITSLLRSSPLANIPDVDLQKHEIGYLSKIAAKACTARRVRLTARGRRYGRDVRKFAEETEADVANRLGARQSEELRKTLALLVESSRRKVDG